MTRLHQTESVCPECFAKVPAQIIEEQGKIYLTKSCAQHGRWKTLIWSDAQSYEAWKAFSIEDVPLGRGLPVEQGCPFDCGLCQAHRGSSCTVVLEVTQRCNMRCPVCFASSSPKEQDDPPLEEIREMYAEILHSSGICSVQLSGGECTLRDDLPEIIRIGKSMGFKHIQINTNGIRIAQDPDYLAQLVEAGGDLLYLQFDGMEDRVYEYTRGRKFLTTKLTAVENAEKAGIGVMLVPTLIQGVNDDQIGSVVDFARAHVPVVKGIHFQPVSYFGRVPQNLETARERYTLIDVVKGLETQTKHEIRSEHIVPRKKMSAYCSFSALYALDDDGTLIAMTNRENQKEALLNEMQNYQGIKERGREFFADKANQFTEKFWKIQQLDECECSKNVRWAAFLNRLQTRTLSLSAMPFQDIYTIDLERVQSCCVHVMDRRKRLIPLCLYYLTNTRGERLYGNG